VNHARIADQDKRRYTVKLLRQWKRLAEEEAGKRLAVPQVGRIVHDDFRKFSVQAKSVVAALRTFKQGSHMPGVDRHLREMALTVELLGIPNPVEIYTLPYPEGVEAHNPFLQDRFEGGCVIRFPDGSEESGICAHASGLEILSEYRDSAIVALEHRLIRLEHQASLL
jgi:hypothetical protein